MSRLHSTCPGEISEEKQVFQMFQERFVSCWFIIFWHFQRKTCRLLSNPLRQVCEDCILRVQTNVFNESFFDRKTLLLLFSLLGRKFFWSSWFFFGKVVKSAFNILQVHNVFQGQKSCFLSNSLNSLVLFELPTKKLDCCWNNFELWVV